MIRIISSGLMNAVMYLKWLGLASTFWEHYACNDEWICPLMEEWIWRIMVIWKNLMMPALRFVLSRYWQKILARGTFCVQGTIILVIDRKRDRLLYRMRLRRKYLSHRRE